MQEKEKKTKKNPIPGKIDHDISSSDGVIGDIEQGIKLKKIHKMTEKEDNTNKSPGFFSKVWDFIKDNHIITIAGSIISAVLPSAGKIVDLLSSILLSKTKRRVAGTILTGAVGLTALSGVDINSSSVNIIAIIVFIAGLVFGHLQKHYANKEKLSSAFKGMEDIV